MLPRNVMESPMNRTLELRPKRLHAIDMNLAANMLPLAVANPAMLEPLCLEAVIAVQFIGEHRCARHDFGSDIRNKGFRFAIRNDRCIDTPAASQDTSDNRFAIGSATALPMLLAADVGFIRFDNPFKHRNFARHKLADLMVHSPCRFVGNPDLAHKLHRRNTVAAGRHNEQGVEPSPQRRGGFVEDRPGSGRNLMAAPSAFKLFARVHAVKAVRFAAHASAAVWEPPAKQVLQAGTVIRKLFVKIFDRVFHFHGYDLTKATWTNAVQVKNKVNYVPLRDNPVLFCAFSRFDGFFLMQVVVRQHLADSGRLQKKSCRKTYGRFFGFGGFW